MLLVFSHFSVSRPLLTNLPSFPLGQTTFSTPWVPVGLGPFPGLVLSHHLQPATAAGPPSATCGERARPPALWCGCSPGKPWTSFSHDSWNSVSYSISLNWTCHLVRQKIGGFICFLSQPKISLENSPTFFFLRLLRFLFRDYAAALPVTPYHLPPKPHAQAYTHQWHSIA